MNSADQFESAALNDWQPLAQGLAIDKSAIGKGIDEERLVALGAAHEEVMRKIDPGEGEGQSLAQL